MSNDKPGSGKGPSPGGDTSGPKKPAAIIDLKASEVTTPAKPSAATGPTGGASPTSPSTATAVPIAGGKPAVPPAAGTPTGKPADKAADKDAGKPATATPPPAEPARSAVKAAAAQADASATKPAAAPVARGGGFVSLLTHLTAGIAGGLLALVGADTLGEKLGIPLPAQQAAQQTTGALQQRLAALEGEIKSRAGAPTDVGAKLAAAERKIADLEKLTGDLATLRSEQSKLNEQSKALDERLAAVAQVQPTADAARLAKLEEALAALSAAAGTDAQRGRIPQLAAITGKLADLESAVGTQITALRKGVTQEVDTRLASIAETSEAAKIGTQRIDRELASVKGDATRLTQRFDALKVGADQLTEQVRTLETTTAALKSELTSQLKTVAKPADIKSAVAPVESKISALETSVQGVLKAEGDRKANAERIVLSLELGNLKRAVDRGGAFAKELAEVQKVSGGKVDLAALDKYKATGVPTLADLGRELRQQAYTIIDAEKAVENAGVVDKLLSSAQSVVRVRRTEVAADDKSAEAVVARMEAAIKAGSLGGAIEAAKALPAKSLAAARAWLDKAEARNAAEQAIAAIDNQLKASLSGTTAAKGTQ